MHIQNGLILPSNIIPNIYTVSTTHSRSIAHLWYDLGVLWLSIMYLKSAAKHFFSNYSNKYSLDLSKYEKIIHFSPQNSDLWAPKVYPGRDSNPGRSRSSNSLYKLAKNVASNPKGLGFFLTANFQSPQFCNCLSWNFEILSI